MNCWTLPALDSFAIAGATDKETHSADHRKRFPRTEEFARETTLLHRVLERCGATGHRLVFLSTASTGMYGGAGPGSEDQPVTTSSDYGRHKRALERTVSESGVDHLVLRLSHVTDRTNGPTNSCRR